MKDLDDNTKGSQRKYGSGSKTQHTHINYVIKLTTTENSQLPEQSWENGGSGFPQMVSRKGNQ